MMQAAGKFSSWSFSQVSSPWRGIMYVLTFIGTVNDNSCPSLAALLLCKFELDLSPLNITHIGVRRRRVVNSHTFYWHNSRFVFTSDNVYCHNGTHPSWQMHQIPHSAKNKPLVINLNFIYFAPVCWFDLLEQFHSHATYPLVSTQKQSLNWNILASTFFTDHCVILELVILL